MFYEYEYFIDKLYYEISLKLMHIIMVSEAQYSLEIHEIHTLFLGTFGVTFS